MSRKMRRKSKQNESRSGAGLQISVRGIGPELAKAIRRVANEHGIPSNQAVLKLLAKGANLLPGAVIGHDLDHLFGTWQPAEAKSFLQSISLLRAGRRGLLDGFSPSVLEEAVKGFSTRTPTWRSRDSGGGPDQRQLEMPASDN